MDDRKERRGGGKRWLEYGERTERKTKSWQDEGEGRERKERGGKGGSSFDVGKAGGWECSISDTRIKSGFGRLASGRLIAGLRTLIERIKSLAPLN